jgi:NADPH2:quinone reductase
MNAAVVSAFDAPPRYCAFAEPVAAEGEKIVHVTVAGVHPVVKAIASGTHYASPGELPFVPGVDGVGRLEDGTRVYFGISRKPFGTFAERAPAAAGIANPAMSSWVALKVRAKFVAGESVAILGATGVAGQLAVQIAKRLGARRVIAAGRNPQALEKVRELGADATVSLLQEHEALVSAFRREWAEAGVDVVLDYLWGHPAESVLEAISQKGLKIATSPVRFIQIGESAGHLISLPAATLRSSKLELLGSGFGSASFEQIWHALGEFFDAAANEPFQFNTRIAPLQNIDAHWNSPEQGVRLVFQP